MRLAIFFALLLSASSGFAQPLVIQIIPLNQHSAEEVLPVLRPLIPPPGTVSGYRGQLVIKSTQENIEEVRSVLAQIDRRARNLFITVRHGSRKDREFDRMQAFGRSADGNVDVNNGNPPKPGGGGITIIDRSGAGRVGVHTLGTRSRRDQRDDQRIRVLEGRPAFISVGETVPVAKRLSVSSGGGTVVQDTIDYKSATSGFYVRAQLSGPANVLLDISTERTRRSPEGGGRFDVQTAYTTVSGRLGQWIALGGDVEHAARSDRGFLRSTHSQEQANRQIFLRVDIAH